MATQERIKGTDGPKVPRHIEDLIVELKKKQDAAKRAKGKEREAQAAANQACVAAGYEDGQVLHLPDQSPPLWFKVTKGDPKVVVKVEGREKRDDIHATGDSDDDGGNDAPAGKRSRKREATVQ